MAEKPSDQAVAQAYWEAFSKHPYNKAMREVHLRAIALAASLQGGDDPVAWRVTSDDSTITCYAEATAQAQAFELRKGGYPATVTPLYTATPPAELARDAALAELISAAEAAEALAICVQSVDGYSREELVAFASNQRGRLRKAIAAMGDSNRG